MNIWQVGSKRICRGVRSNPESTNVDSRFDVGHRGQALRCWCLCVGLLLGAFTCPMRGETAGPPASEAGSPVVSHEVLDEFELGKVELLMGD